MEAAEAVAAFVAMLGFTAERTAARPDRGTGTGAVDALDAVFVQRTCGPEIAGVREAEAGDAELEEPD